MGTSIPGSYPIFHLPPAQRHYLCHILNPQAEKIFMGVPTHLCRAMDLKMRELQFHVVSPAASALFAM